jgi:lipid A 4'-phosphatase
MLRNPRTIPILLILIAGVFGIWMADPELDLRLSDHYFQDGTFLGAQGDIVQLLRMQFWNLSLGLAWLSLGAVLLSYLLKKSTLLGIARRDWNVILWGFLLGPGLLVNAIFKTYSGRARPQDVLNFGGDRIYTPIGEIANQCARDCSFVSGEVSGTTATCIALLMILAAQAHRLPKMVLWLAQLSVLGIFAFVFWQRVASGGHFVSDAILAALFTGLVMAILARYWPQSADRVPTP